MRTKKERITEAEEQKVSQTGHERASSSGGFSSVELVVLFPTELDARKGITLSMTGDTAITTLIITIDINYTH